MHLSKKCRIVCICSIKEAVFTYFSIPFISGCFLIKINKTSNTSMKRYAETGSLWGAPLSRLKYWVVVPPFMKHDCWSFNKISIQVMKFFPKPNFFKTEIRKLRSRESKAFSISIVTRKPVILKQPLISIMSEINLSLPPINLFFYISSLLWRN